MATTAPGAIAENGGLDAALMALSAAFGNRLATSRAIGEQHADTTTWVAGALPDAVVFARSTADVQAAVRICAEQRMPVIHSEQERPSKGKSTRLMAAFRSISMT